MARQPLAAVAISMLSIRARCRAHSPNAPLRTARGSVPTISTSVTAFIRRMPGDTSWKSSRLRASGGYEAACFLPDCSGEQSLHEIASVVTLPRKDIYNTVIYGRNDSLRSSTTGMTAWVHFLIKTDIFFQTFLSFYISESCRLPFGDSRRQIPNTSESYAGRFCPCRIQ